MASKKHGKLGTAIYLSVYGPGNELSSNGTPYTVPSGRKATVTVRVIYTHNTSEGSGGQSNLTISSSGGGLSRWVLSAPEILLASDTGILLGGGEAITASLNTNGSGSANASIHVYGIEEDA